MKGLPAGETHFRMSVVSQEFEGLTTIKRHKLVYQVIHHLSVGSISLAPGAEMMWDSGIPDSLGCRENQGSMRCYADIGRGVGWTYSCTVTQDQDAGRGVRGEGGIMPDVPTLTLSGNRHTTLMNKYKADSFQRKMCFKARTSLA